MFVKEVRLFCQPYYRRIVLEEMGVGVNEIAISELRLPLILANPEGERHRIEPWPGPDDHARPSSVVPELHRRIL